MKKNQIIILIAVAVALVIGIIVWKNTTRLNQIGDELDRIKPGVSDFSTNFSKATNLFNEANGMTFAFGAGETADKASKKLTAILRLQEEKNKKLLRQ